MILVEGLGITLEILGLDRRIDGQLRRHRIGRNEQTGGDCPPDFLLNLHGLRTPCRRA